MEELVQRMVHKKGNLLEFREDDKSKSCLYIRLTSLVLL